MQFADKSGSMSGTPFKAMKEGMATLADTIFADDPADNAFDEVHTVFYGSQLFPHVTNKKAEYLNKVNNEYVSGMTNFVDCLQYIEKAVMKEEEGTRFSILFLTDGNESCNPKDKLTAQCETLKDILKTVEVSGGKSSSIYTLGFSQHHDATLLNNLA